MASTSPMLLILGGGANVGHSVARAFAAKDYRQRGSYFWKVKQTLGVPSVVVYNAHSNEAAPKDDPLALSVADLTRDLQVNTISVHAAAREAVAGFRTLPASATRTFIYTGNILNETPLSGFVSLGIGKSGTAHLIAQSSLAYRGAGYKFHYADQRTVVGFAVYLDISGPAHGEFFTELAEGNEEIPWHATFVVGKGYSRFIVQESRELSK